METLVITGGIGSGKSEVCAILYDMGFHVQYNADKRVKALYEEHPALLKRIEESLGVCLRDSEGRFQAKLLSKIIFEESEALEKVESLVFPALVEDFTSFIDGYPDERTVIFESATVLEKPFFDGFGDKTILVYAPYSTRLERACGRDNARKEDVEARMACQPLMNALSGYHMDSRVDAVIVNDAGIDELKERTCEAVSRLFDN